MHLLLVEDDQRLARVLRRLLEDDRHVVEVAHDGESGVEIATSAAGIEVVILDVGLPDISGLEVARRVRKAGGEMAILMLTARDTVNDRVTGLDAGADDYLVKPFAFEELAARLRALARRTETGPRRPDPVIAVGPIKLDEKTRRVTVEGRAVELSPREFALLEFLVHHAGEVVTRGQILEHVWDFGYNGISNVVNVYVGHLRRKLEEPFGRPLIHTVRGVGYVLEQR